MEIIKIEAKELSLVENNSLNANQLALLLKKTPKQYVHTRPAKGGGTWDYVSGGYVRKVLNLMFGWDWDFEVVSEQVVGKQVIVKGKLTCRVNGRQIVKMQFGCKEVICRSGTETPLNLGNDFKAAATDALKKCAAELGIAADIYNKQDFKEITVNTQSNDQVNDLTEVKRITDFIADAKTPELLVTVYDSVQHYGLVKIYDAKLSELKGGQNG
jgi:recombination DNA repair RAD52 pathway protein